MCEITLLAKKCKRLESEIKNKNETIKDLEDENLMLQEAIDELSMNNDIKTKVDRKTYSPTTRMKVFY